MKKFLILQFRERRVRSVAVVVDSSVLLVTEKVFDLLPAEVSLALLVHHQVAEHQEEAVAGQVEAPPQMTVGDAGLLAVIPGHLTQPALYLDGIEQARDREPDDCGEDQPRHLVLDHGHPPAAVGGAGGVHEAGQQHQGPKPPEFHKPLIDEIVRICKVAPEMTRHQPG